MGSCSTKFDRRSEESYEGYDRFGLNDHQLRVDGGWNLVSSTPKGLETVSDEDDDPSYQELSRDDSRKRDDILGTSHFQLNWWDEQREDHGPYSPLTDEEERTVFDAMRGVNRSRFEVLVKHEASSIEITREVFLCLRYSAWLNDEVINLYLELLKEREKREPNRFLKCHFFNTFFYDKLFRATNSYDFDVVRRWTSRKKLGYDLIECDKIFVPIHKDIHWSLAVINVKEESFQYLDSLGGMDNNVLAILATYFMDEVKDKSDKQIDSLNWKQEAVDDLPLQMNVWDCGMFMLKYVDFYSRGSSLDFHQGDITYFRKRTALEILRLRAE